MNLTFLDTLKSISGYTDIRSVRAWLTGMNVSLIHIGKKYAVDTDAFEKALLKKQRITKRDSGYKPKQKTEKQFLSGLDRLLSKHTEV